MEKHTKNIQLYISSGGNPKLAKRHETPTLQNRAKISFLLAEQRKKNKEQRPIAPILQPAPIAPIAPIETPIEKPKFLGLIAQYPQELHSVYQEAYQLWIEACSLKIKLNAVPDEDELLAKDIQFQIFKIFEKFDKCKKHLDYYLEHTRILPVETKADFSKLSPFELMRKRENLYNSIFKRKQTLEKRIAELPEETDPKYLVRKNFILNKTEELQELELDLMKLDQLIKE